MLKRQYGKCAICAVELTVVEQNGAFFAGVVDHDHETSQVRAFLCGHCNSALGFLRDKPHLALAAWVYLSHFKKDTRYLALQRKLFNLQYLDIQKFVYFKEKFKNA